ncbi:MAG: lysophospholipid acyltransferase family protein [Cytophagaceae bacterium]
MKKVLSIILFIKIYALSLLPLRVLYLISDFLFVLVFYVFKYRRTVVQENLANAFPEKTPRERRQIEKKFFRYLCDLMVEILKKLTLSKKEGYRRCSLKNADLTQRLAQENKNIIAVTGHYANWEWGDLCLGAKVTHQVYAIYKPLSNKPFNSLMKKMRTRFGMKLISMRETYRAVVSNNDHLNATYFIADQTPSAEGAYWTRFLNQDTAVFKGAARIAKKMGYPVLYVVTRRKGRGIYEMELELIVEDPSTLTEEEICELYTRRLEEDILKEPELWLWSHRRWKHKRP